jgi:hypothetical protein
MRWIVVLVILAALAGCAESSAEVNTPSAWDTKAANPQFAQAAQRALATAPTSDPGWRVGVVFAERPDSDEWGTPPWAVSVLTREGQAIIEASWSEECDDGRHASDEFPLLLDPGDLITWAGDSRTVHEVCAEDMRIIRKAAA